MYQDEMQQAGVPPPLGFNTSMVGPVIAQFGSRAQKQRYPAARRQSRRLVVPGLLRARRRVRPRRAAHHGQAGRRYLGDQRPEDLDHAGAVRRLDLRAVPHRSRRQEAGGHQLHPGRHEDARASPCGRSRPSTAATRSTRCSSTMSVVPAENLVGEENKGWDYAKFLLGNERTGIARVGTSKARLKRIRELAALERVGDTPVIEDPKFREKLAEVEIELKALEMTQLRVVAAERGARQGQAEPGLVDPEAEGLGDPAGDHRADDGRGRAVRDAVSSPATRDGRNEPVIGPDYAAAAAPHLFQLPQGLDLRRLQRDPAQHRRQGDPGLLTVHQRMDFDLIDDQRLLKDSVDRLIADRYGFEQRKKYRASRMAGAATIWAQIRRTRPAGPAVRRGAWRLRRRPGRDHDRDGGVRPRPGAGAVSRDRGARRRAAAPCRRRGAAGRRCCRRSRPAS